VGGGRTQGRGRRRGGREEKGEENEEILKQNYIYKTKMTSKNNI
jgi:hypothetical protein